MLEKTMTRPQGEDLNCLGILGTNWFSTGRQDNIRSKQRKDVGGERMYAPNATRSLPQETPQSERTLTIPLQIVNNIDTNPRIGGQSGQPPVSQASTVMQGLPPAPSVYKRQPQLERAQTMPVNMAQPQQARTVSNPQGYQQHVSSAPRMTSTQQFQAGNRGGLSRRNAMLGTRNVGATSVGPGAQTVSQCGNT